MEENRNDRAVEKKMKDALRYDRARVQMGKISAFGLLEISRQRRRTGVLEGSSHICEACDGVGRVRSPESASLQALRAVEAAVANRRDCEVALHADIATALYLLNEKRDHLSRLFTDRGLVVRVFAESDMNAGQYRFEIVEPGEEVAEALFVPVFVKVEDPVEEDGYIIEGDDVDADDDEDDDGAPSSRTTASEDEDGEVAREGSKRRRRRRRGKRSDEPVAKAVTLDENGEPIEADGTEDEDAGASDASPDSEETQADAEGRRRRRRGRRGGRRRREGEVRAGDWENDGEASAEAVVVIEGMEVISDDISTDETVVVEDMPEAQPPPKRKRPTRKKKEDVAEEVAVETPPEVLEAIEEPSAVAPKKPATRRKAAAKPAVVAEEPVEAATPAAIEPTSPATEVAASDVSSVEVPPADTGPRRSGWWSRNAKKLFGTE